MEIVAARGPTSIPFYFYLWDAEGGAAFWRTTAYAPFPIWLGRNGHQWAQRQWEKAGMAYGSPGSRLA
jgi:hypothetical protein